MTAPASLDLSQLRHPDTAFQAGIAALKAEQEQRLVPFAKSAVARYPADPRLWQVLGLAYRKLEDMGPSVQAFEKAAALASRDPLIVHGLARSALEAGLPSAELFERAHRLAPLDAQVLLGRAAAQLADGRIEDAIAGLETQLRQHPGWLPGHATLARLRWMAGDKAGFTRSFEEALAVAGSEVQLWRELADTQMHANLFENALATLERARQSLGEHPALLATRAVCLAEMGHTEEADAAFRKIGPIEHITLLVRYVRHLLRSGRVEQAAAAAEARIADDQDKLLWPYLSAAWRLTGDPRWAWLEGDPRLIGVYDIAADLPSLDDLAQCLRRLHLTKHQPLEQSVRGGTQTDGPLLARIEPEIRALRAAVVKAVEAHAAQLPPHDPKHPTLAHARTPIRFAGSWSVRLTEGGFHSNHIHPAGWFSSALYVALPDPAERGPEPAGWLSLGEVTELGLDLPPVRLVEPKPGRLVLFPSTMWHGTKPFSRGERMTVAFDVAPPR